MKLFKKPKVGLDIGSHTIKVVGLRETRELAFCHLEDLVERYQVKKREDIVDEMHIETLRDLVRQFSLKNKGINCVVYPDTAIIRCLELPKLPADDLKNAIKWEMMDILSDDIEAFEIDYQLLTDATISDGRCKVLVGAMPRSEIERYLKILSEAGLKVQTLDLKATAVHNAFQVLVPPANSQVRGVISIGARHTTCIVTQVGKPPFFHTSPIGGDDISNALMDEWHLSFTRADFVKKHYGKDQIISHIDLVLLGLQEHFAKMQSRIRSVLESFISEIDRSLKHFQACEKITTIDHLYLTGGGAKLKNLDKILMNRLRIPTLFWNPLDSDYFVDSLMAEAVKNQIGAHMAGSIGAALREAENADKA